MKQISEEVKKTRQHKRRKGRRRGKKIKIIYLFLN